MAKVFTIATGLENMGAMKTGGQGSVYKGRRIGEIITAIKLLPTPIYSESEDDKNYRDFKNEVQKLYKVNEIPNPNVVKILSSGLSETGNFPYIEMDFIEGPDLEELLKPPHDPVFTIKEVIKVAEQLSHALAHCHKVNVKHGDIKSNNVKYNLHTGNYVLLDFGLAVMSDEQRRTSLRHAGAIEFMAPEQNEGLMLFETDVYSFGVIIFELLAGQVPFPLHDKGETARNMIRLSHIENLPPDVALLRSEALPAAWSQEKKDAEMHVPDWLLKMMDKCLEKKPENRFRNGTELHDYIVYESTHVAVRDSTGQLVQSSTDAEKLAREKEQYYQQLVQYRQQLAVKDKEILELKAASKNEAVFSKETDSAYAAPQTKGVSVSSFIMLLLLTIGLGAFSAYSVLKNSKKGTPETGSTGKSGTDSTNSAFEQKDPEPAQTDEETTAVKQKPVKPVPKTDSLVSDESSQNIAEQNQNKQPEEHPENSTHDYIIPNNPVDTDNPSKSTAQYQVTIKAYFYSSPDETTRRNAYMVPSDNAVLKAQDDQNGFIYVVFTNQTGQTSRGWLRKKDLKPVSE